MRARVDADDAHPIDIVQRIYTAEFLETLGQRFKFDAMHRKLPPELSV